MPASESFPWALWGTVADASLLFLYVMSISIAYIFGSTAHPVIMAVVAALIPYFSFWLLPWILVLFTAINDRPLFV